MQHLAGNPPWRYQEGNLIITYWLISIDAYETNKSVIMSALSNFCIRSFFFFFFFFFFLFRGNFFVWNNLVLLGFMHAIAFNSEDVAKSGMRNKIQRKYGNSGTL